MESEKTDEQLTGMGKAIAVEKEKLVGSLMFRKNGQRSTSVLKSEDLLTVFPNINSILEKFDLIKNKKQFRKDEINFT